MKQILYNNPNERLVTSEAVSYGHPDKIADQIADAILDACLLEDPETRAGIEVLVKDNIIVLGGEIHTNALVNYDVIARTVVSSIGFSKQHHLGFDELKVINLIGQQSNEIRNGVDNGEQLAAGDQGFMVGYACNETKNYMPLGMYLARTICDGVVSAGYGPDAKAQVIVAYDSNGWPIRVEDILVSTMHENELSEVRRDVKNMIRSNNFRFHNQLNGIFVSIDETIYKEFIMDKNINIDVNPCGTWRIGGPVSDCGVTGRKLVVDAYGGYCNIGGGNASGKCFSKVDRSGAYMARYLAKNIVASGICDKAKVVLSYKIGVVQPCSIQISLNKNKTAVGEITQYIINNIDLSPEGIIQRFNGKKAQYQITSRLGHYGIETYPWEKVDFADKLKRFLKN